MIHKSAVLHIPLSNYAYPEEEDTFVIRLRCGRDDLTSCTLYYGDRASMESPVQFRHMEMRHAGHDGEFDYYEAVLRQCWPRICYYFRLEQGEEWTYYYADEFTQVIPDKRLDGVVIEGRSEYYQYPYILRTEILDVPAWFKEAVVYNIFPDSFASGRRELEPEAKERTLRDGKVIRANHGGTLQGIRENLDYIQELGFNCIYLNPVFVAGEYHKYDILDYHKIDPGMGTEEEFGELVEEVHKRGMHIIIDGVFNHCSWHFFAFEDVVENGENSRYCDWFYHLEFPVVHPGEGQIPGYACFAYEKSMPKLNTANEQVQNYFAGVGAYWVEKYHVDGWRLDVANEVDRNFWRKFRKAVKDANPEAVLIGEVWENSETWLKGDAFDSTMNYDFRKHCRTFFAEQAEDAEQFENRMTKMRYRYPRKITQGQLNLLDSHDVPRFLSLCGRDLIRWKQAFIYLMMAPGVPSVFYGDEQGLYGLKEPEYRQAMPWRQRDRKLEGFVREVIGIRRKWILPEDGYVRREDGRYPELLTAERTGSGGNIRFWLNLGEDAELPEEIGHAEVLLAEGQKERTLARGGYLIVRMEKTEKERVHDGG